MQTQIVFGDSWVTAELPDGTHRVGPGVSLGVEPIEDIDAAAAHALANPIDTPPLVSLAREASRVLIAFDDPTVPCYAPVWPFALKNILRTLADAGVEDDKIELVCANALHRKFTGGEIAKLIGEDLVRWAGPRFACHDAEDSNAMIPIGRTANGLHVDLNRKAVEADLVIYVNCSTTRGFSGGWKSICVGLASYRSIAHHHTPDIMSMSMGRNQMHEMLDEMGVLTESELGREKFFKFETVLANPLQPAAFFTGSVGATRAAAMDMNRTNMANRRDLIDEKADVVLYGVPDWSPYAAYSHTNPILTLISTALGYLGGMIEALGKPGCTAIIATPCIERWDDVHHPSYRDVWERVLPERKDPYEARAIYEEEFATDPRYIDSYRNGFGFHGVHGIMALYPLKRLRHASRIIVAGPHDRRLPEHVGFEWAPTVEDALASVDGSPSVAFVDYPAAFNRE
ncbi:MAG: nickel-dependent lactate racemase [Actinobacteria bacterium]|nr:nickel-dependent lactate racemase [Actinomycetota bacterium]